MSNRVMNHDTAGEALLHTMLGNDVADISPAASRAQKFCWGFPFASRSRPLDLRRNDPFSGPKFRFILTEVLHGRL